MAPPHTLLAMSRASRANFFPEPVLAELASVSKVDTGLLVTDFGEAALTDALAEVEVLLTAWGCPRVTEDALTRMPLLRAIVHAGGTVKVHVTPACWDRGIEVSSAADANAVPVAEYTLAAILFSGKRVLQSAHWYRSQRVPAGVNAALPDLGNYGRTVGLIGASRIGRRVAALLRPFDFRVLVYDPHVGDEEIFALGAEPSDLDALLVACDIVSVHAPELPETRHLLDRRRLALLRDGATVINTARGSLIDTTALTEHLAMGRLHAVLDVTDPEPISPSSPLFDLPNVLLTPHIAGSIGNELQRLVRSAIDELRRHAAGLPFAYPVNPLDLAISA